MSDKLSRIFGGDGFFGGGAWWIIVLFFLFLAFQECWSEICITDWIPYAHAEVWMEIVDA